MTNDELINKLFQGSLNYIFTVTTSLQRAVIALKYGQVYFGSKPSLMRLFSEVSELAESGNTRKTSVIEPGILTFWNAIRSVGRWKTKHFTFKKYTGPQARWILKMMMIDSQRGAQSRVGYNSVF